MHDAESAEYGTPAVSTLLLSTEQTRIDAAGHGVYTAVHRTSITEVLDDLRHQRAAAVMLSLSRYDVDSHPTVARMVREFPSVPTIAVLSSMDEQAAYHALRLGQCGVRTVIDTRRAQGWQELRTLIQAQRHKDIRRRALAAVEREIGLFQDDGHRFFETIFRQSASVTTTRQVARVLGIKASSLMSRFFRLQLPSPKRYLSFTRLLVAAQLFENPGFSIANVANELDYSSPQSFGRHVRTYLDLTARQFRDTYDSDGMLEVFLDQLIRPYRSRLAVLSPTGLRSRPGDA
jgi:AraC-like DNA-binding protein